MFRLKPTRSWVAGALAVTMAAMLVFAQPSAAGADDTLGEVPLSEVPSVSVDDGEPGPMAILPDTHRCTNFGWWGGERGGVCASLDTFTNSSGLPAIRGQAQTFCQRESDAVIIRCQYIKQTIYVYNSTIGVAGPSRTFECHECPNGRFQNLSAGVYRYCNHTYWTLVTSLVRLPYNGRLVTNYDWYSASFTPRTNCLI